MRLLGGNALSTFHVKPRRSRPSYVIVLVEELLLHLVALLVTPAQKFGRLRVALRRSGQPAGLIFGYMSKPRTPSEHPNPH